MKPPDEGDSLRAKPKVNSLESYRRLIELQKQMIELSQQHEQSKRECAALREQVAREITAQSRSRRTIRQRAQQSASELLRRVPWFGSGELKMNLLNNKKAPSW